MNFSPIATTPELQSFDDEVCAFVETLLARTDPDGALREVHAFNEPMHLALGERGWLFPTYPPDKGGAGLDPIRARLLQVRLAEYQAVSGPLGTTRLAWSGIERHVDEPLRSELLAGITSGRTRFCLGYTEPDGGSDVASAKVRAVRDGDEWVVNGSKMFTSWIQWCHYVFLVTRTDPGAPKHAGLTMFLVPVDAHGVEYQRVETLSGELTSISFYDDVRVPDRLRIGPVDEGWAVLMGPLSEEHGTARSGRGLEDLSIGRSFLRALEHALAEAAAFVGREADDVTRFRLGQVATDLEAGIVAPGAMGRILGSDVVIRGAAELCDLVGARGVIPRGEEGCIGDGWIELTHRYAQGTATYAGTVEVFRTIVARHGLGLPQLDLPGRRAFLR
jgi:alkylation response protein AidB-like acyl-CoA dehydrogenase